MNFGDIRTTTDCPACQEVGKKTPLMYNGETYPAVFCDSKHSFSSVEDAQAYSAFAEPVEAIQAPEVPTSNVTPIRPSPGLEELPAPIHVAPIIPEPPAPAAAPPDPPAPKVAKPNGKYMPPPAREAPGGVLILTVRIPDQHASFLKGEAENQKETVQDYFQRMVEFGMDSRWFY